MANEKNLADIVKDAKMLAELGPATLAYVAPHIKDEKMQQVAYVKLAGFIAEAFTKAPKDNVEQGLLLQLLNYYKSQAGDYFKE